MTSFEVWGFEEEQACGGGVLRRSCYEGEMRGGAGIRNLRGRFEERQACGDKGLRRSGYEENEEI